MTATERLFDQLCARWVAEAEQVLAETGKVAATLVVLPRDVGAEEVAIRVDGLRGNLTERSDALVAELRPAVAPYEPAGVVLMLEMRLAQLSIGLDGVVVYVTLGAPGLRRARGFTTTTDDDGTRRLVPAIPDPPVDQFAWLDALLTQPG